MHHGPPDPNGRHRPRLRLRLRCRPTVRPVGARTLVAVALATIGAWSLVACGGGEDRVALAITSTSWSDDGALLVGTECAAVEAPSITDGAGADEPPTIALWGSPRVGRCRPVARVDLPPEVTKVVDAATSQVIDLPPRP